jgi:DNA (cytosine-5)-methyltransferase 1
MTSPDWQLAACADVDPELFHPEHGAASESLIVRRAAYAPAKRICNGTDAWPVCPVRAQCLAWKVDHEDGHGVWGGLDPMERQNLRQQSEPARVRARKAARMGRAAGGGEMRPRLLDLFCGAGGAGVGYQRAGFDVTGVDTSPARVAEYPFEAHRGDAIEYLLAHGHEFDAIHASPPCTGYTRGTAAIPDRLTRYDRLIAATREALVIVGRPWVIENVADARSELRDPLLLCWSMFHEPGSVLDANGTPLRMERHRLFESSTYLTAPAGCNHPKAVQVAGAYGGARRDAWEARHVRKGGYVPASLDVLRALLGTPWMSETGCFLSIPPAYSAWIGTQLLDHLNRAVA